MPTRRSNMQGSEQIISQAAPVLAFCKAIVVREDSDMNIISTCGNYNEVKLAAEQLAPRIQTRVLSMPTIKLLDENALLKAASETSLLA